MARPPQEEESTYSTGRGVWWGPQLRFASVSVVGRGDPFQGQRTGSRLTLRNEFSKETHVLAKQEALLDSEQQSKGRTAHGLRFYGVGVSFEVVSGQSFCLAHS